MDKEFVSAIAADLLQEIFSDQDWGLDHVKKTPERYVKALRELAASEPFEFTTFKNQNHLNEMVLVRDIKFHSLCAHHILPFIGIAHIAYIPGERIAGLSKLARTVKHLQSGLWVQEELTDAIAQFLVNHLQPQGVAVVMQAEHLCMTLRGVQAPGTMTTTSKMTGVFADHSRLARQEFLALIKQ